MFFSFTCRVLKDYELLSCTKNWFYQFFINFCRHQFFINFKKIEKKLVPNFSSILGEKLRKNWFPIFSQFFGGMDLATFAPRTFNIQCNHELCTVEFSGTWKKFNWKWKEFNERNVTEIKEIQLKMKEIQLKMKGIYFKMKGI